MSHTPILTIHDLSALFPNENGGLHVLEQITFNVHPREFVCVLGPSGSGKSTLMHILGFLDKASCGKYVFDGRDVRTLSGEELADMRSKKVGFVFQAFNLLPRTTVVENVALPLVYAHDGGNERVRLEKQLTNEDLGAMIDQNLVRAHRARGLSPDHPVLRGTPQNPDVYFQARETVNPYYAACPEIVQKYMDRFAGSVGRQYQLFDYGGAPDAERVIVIMGSGGETASETAKYLNNQGEKVGVLNVHLYRPFSVKHFIAALPSTVKRIAVLDRTKERGSTGEPLYQDVVTAISEGQGVKPNVIGGRYGLSSKDFTPAMVKAVFDEFTKPEPKNHFTVGILDDVSHTSLDFDPDFDIEAPETVRCVFWGLGSDGTVGAKQYTEVGFELQCIAGWWFFGYI